MSRQVGPRRRPGVYQIVCLKNGRRYIGQSGDCPARWAQHMDDLFAGRHVNTALQDDWNQHSHKEFSFTLLEQEPDEEERLAREQHYIRAELDRCYNVAWDDRHVIQGGVIVNRSTWKPLDPPKPPSPASVPGGDIVAHWAHLQRQR